LNFLPKNIFPGALILSILIHLLLLAQLNWSPVTKASQEKLIEVSLLELETTTQRPRTKHPAPQKSKKQQSSTVEKVKNKPLSPDTKITKNRKPTSAVSVSGQKDTGAIKVKKVTPKPVSPSKPTFKSSLSLKSNLVSGATGLKEPLVVDANKLQKYGAAKADASIQPKTKAVDKPSKGVTAEQVKPGKTPIAIDGQHLPQMAETKKSASKQSTSSQGANEIVNSFIEGEARTRKILFRPPPPELNIERDVEVTLHFTVLPDGSVDTILPYTKADLELEQLAIDLLQQYKFEPLFGSNQKQSGIIHFTISRKR
jgi:hypothetical protein